MTQVQINKINRKLDEVERLVRDIRRELGSTSGPSPSSSGLKKPRTQLQGNYVLMSLSKDMIKWFMQEHFALHDKIKKIEEQKEIEKLKARLKQEEKELSPEPNIEPEKEEKVNETIGEVIELTDFYVTGKEEKEKVEKIDIEINSEENNELDPFEEMQKQEEKEINLAHLKKYGDKKLKSMPDNREIKVHD